MATFKQNATLEGSSKDASPCTTCFLYETRGICRTARDAYGLETPAEIQRRAVALRAAIAHDVHAARSLMELVRGEATTALPGGAAGLALPAGTATPDTHHNHKEVVNVVLADATV